MLLCGLTDKDLRRICGSQYEHPGSAIGYCPETCLGHVYIVLEPVGSARLTFVDARVLLGYLMSGNQMLFGVQDEIPGVTRSLGMVDR